MEGWIDIHAHILPQVDDGAADWEDSAGLLEAAARQGFGHIIATPHFNRKSGLDLILEKYEKLELLEKERNPEPVGISLGQEILYFEDITEYLDQGKALTLAGSRYVLVEFSPSVPYRELERGLRKVAFAGYWPVLAHMERYGCLRDEQHLRDLCECGYWLQMNYGSLEGPWFKADVRWCRRQVEEGRIQVLGSDMHRMDWRAPRIERALNWLEGSVDPELLEAMIWKNPIKIIKEAKKNTD